MAGEWRANGGRNCGQTAKFLVKLIAERNLTEISVAYIEVSCPGEPGTAER